MQASPAMILVGDDIIEKPSGLMTGRGSHDAAFGFH
jgi:hypothetical protein